MCEVDMPDRSSKTLVLVTRGTVLAIVVDYGKDQSDNLCIYTVPFVSRNGYVRHRGLLGSFMQI